MINTCAKVIAIAAMAQAAHAQSVDFRIVERTGQTTVTSLDPTLDFAVQARVTSSSHTFLSGFAFNIVVVGEADTWGTLTHGRISNADGTYTATFASSGGSPVVGVHGLAKSYTALAASDATFNGVINTSTSTFTHNPANQEIGNVSGLARGAALLGTPGLDPANEHNPLTWAGYGSGSTPPAGATATIPDAIGATYFADGAYVDVFRFRYTVSQFSSRSYFFTLQSLTAETATQLVYSNGEWGPASSPFLNPTATGYSIFMPSPTTAICMMGSGLSFLGRRRRRLVK